MWQGGIDFPFTSWYIQESHNFGEGRPEEGLLPKTERSRQETNLCVFLEILRTDREVKLVFGFIFYLMI